MNSERVMGMSLDQLRAAGATHLIQMTEDGFTISRRSKEQAEAFNVLARQALEASGVDFVAFPQPDGDYGYEGLFVIPLADAPD